MDNFLLAKKVYMDYYIAMKSNLSSIAAKKRLGKTKKERSEKARALALKKAAKMTPRQRKLQAKKMLAGRYNKE